MLPVTRTIGADGGNMAVVDVGKGPTVVLVHGTPSWSYEYREVIEALQGECRVVAIDHLGFGRSDRPADGDYTVEAHQRRFAFAMDELDVHNAVFVLHDFGTSFAAAWMLDNPDRVRAVVLANTFLWPAKGPMTAILWFYSTGLGRWLYRVANLSARFLLPWAWGKHRPLTKAVHARYLEPFAHAENRYATAALPAELIGDALGRLESRASQFGQWPVRAVWGLADPLVGAGELAKWKTALPQMSVNEIPAAGHFVAHEAPDAIVEAVQAHLTAD